MGQQEWRQGREQTIHERARRPLDSLTEKRGYAVLEWREKKPYRVTICPMEERTIWRRTTIGKGAKTLFELEESTR